MATAIIAAGTSALASDDFTLTAGQTSNVVLVGAAGAEPDPGAFADVQYKTSANTYIKIGSLKANYVDRIVTLVGPGTFRVNRPASAVSCGVDRD
jgi:hypothetical protein